MARQAARLLSCGYVGLLVALPVGSVFYRALRGGLVAFYHNATGQDALHALVLSLEVAVVAVLANALFGLVAALSLARHRFFGSAVIEALIDLPLSLSPVIVGIALVLCYSSTEGLVGPSLAAHGLRVLFSFPGIVLASAFVSLPYVVRSVQPVLMELGTDQEEAASTLGAGAFTVFFRVTLPSIRWALTYGVLLTTARVLGEFGAVAIVSGNILGRTQTLTLYVDSAFTNFDTASAYADALVLALISIALLGLLSLSRSRQGRFS